MTSGPGENWGSTSPSPKSVNWTSTGMPMAHVVELDARRCSSTNRVPSSSSTSTMAKGYSKDGIWGWCATTKLWTVPRPLAVTVSQSSEWHCGHIGPGGWRSSPHELQRWISSSWRARPFEEEGVVAVDRRAGPAELRGGLGGRGRVGLGVGVHARGEAQETPEQGAHHLAVGIAEGHPGRDEVAPPQGRVLLVGHRLDDLVHRDHVVEAQLALVRLLAVGGHHRGEARLVEDREQLGSSRWPRVGSAVGARPRMSTPAASWVGRPRRHVPWPGRRRRSRRRGSRRPWPPPSGGWRSG